MIEKIDKFIVPETKEERIERLKHASATLKSEFVGLDDIIDKICEAITPWYITPEVIIRPTIISLWGMTGTGKTSIVRKLTALLGLANKTVYFDCGEESNQGTTTVASKINDILNIEEDNNPSKGQINDFVFVFDEFQHARTINEHDEEVDKPNLRSFWNLVDTGMIKSDESNWDTSYFCGFVDDFEDYVEEYPNVPIKNGVIENKKDIENILNTLGFFYYDRGVPGVLGRKKRLTRASAEIPVEDEVMYAPLQIIDDRVYRVIVRKVRSANPELKAVDIISNFKKAKTTSEILQLLKEARKAVIAPKEIDCNKSLVFILGNLDEAFKVEGDINPDIDADIFYDQTSKVTITDIKHALKRRFRAEQIARFGNSIIKYPTLKKVHFEEVIRKEVSRISNGFTATSGIDLKISNNIYELLYAEGVYPVQGVRPVFTTITTIFTPLLSDIIMSGAKKGDTAILDVINPETGYKLKEKEISITFGEKTLTRKIDLVLGELRRPESKKTRYANAVHETGHAVVMSYLTGRIPIAIVAISSNSGGFCITYNPDKVGEIGIREDVDNNVMISMAGYLSEELIFPDKNKRLLGSGNDISEAWSELSDAAYFLGYFEPFQYSNYKTYRAGQPGGIDDKQVKDLIKERFEKLKKETIGILADNKDLIIEVAKKLGSVGEISGNEFLEFISKSKGSLTKKRLEEAKIECSFDYYAKMLGIE